MLLITGAALDDRFGRTFVIGPRIFTIASALAALAPSVEALTAARALQGLGAAIVTPLTLTLLSEAVSAEKRGMALGVWAGVSGLGAVRSSAGRPSRGSRGNGPSGSTCRSASRCFRWPGACASNPMAAQAARPARRLFGVTFAVERAPAIGGTP